MKLNLGLGLGQQRVGSGSSVTPGSGATTFATAPDIQWHAGQSTITMRGNITFNATIAGQIMAVSGLAGGALLEGMVIASGPAAGAKIVKSAQTGGGNGSNGNYVLDTAFTVGSATAMTVVSPQVATVADLLGRCNLSSADGEGPRLMTDALGRKFLRFIAPNNFVGSWLNSQVLTGLDTHNLAVIAVCRVHSQQNAQVLFSPGSKVLATSGLQNLSVTPAGFVAVGTQQTEYNNGAPPANVNKLYAGCQMQVLGSAIATDDGLNASITNTNAARVAVNEQSAVITLSGTTRTINLTGLEIGKISTGTTGTTGAQYAFIDLYEMSVWSQGQMGNRAAMPARFDANMASAMTNFAIPAITDNLVFLGDSRTVNGVAHQSANGADGSGYNVATIIAEPASGLPTTTRVLNYAITGQGIGRIGSLLTRTVNANNRATPIMTSMMLGGGHDRIHIHSGINDLGSLWPTDNFAANTSGIADEMYGTDRSASFTATIANNTTSMSVTGVTGQIKTGSQIALTGALAGLTVDGGAGPYTLNMFQSPAITAVAGTSNLQSYKSVIETLLQRGWKITLAREISYATPDLAGTTELRAKMANIVADVTTDIGAGYAANLKTYDLSQITVAGSKLFGANYAGSVVTNNIYVDGVHETAVGKRLLVSGADTPANGILANV